jgi:hypothetical protein
LREEAPGRSHGDAEPEAAAGAGPETGAPGHRLDSGEAPPGHEEAAAPAPSHGHGETAGHGA